MTSLGILEFIEIAPSFFKASQWRILGISKIPYRDPLVKLRGGGGMTQKAKPEDDREF